MIIPSSLILRVILSQQVYPCLDTFKPVWTCLFRFVFFRSVSKLDSACFNPLSFSKRILAFPHFFDSSAVILVKHAMQHPLSFVLFRLVKLRFFKGRLFSALPKLRKVSESQKFKIFFFARFLELIVTSSRAVRVRPMKFQTVSLSAKINHD